jgi:hypothetical protein
MLAGKSVPRRQFVAKLASSTLIQLKLVNSAILDLIIKVLGGSVFDIHKINSVVGEQVSDLLKCHLIY